MRMDEASSNGIDGGIETTRLYGSRTSSANPPHLPPERVIWHI